MLLYDLDKAETKFAFNINFSESFAQSRDEKRITNMTILIEIFNTRVKEKFKNEF